MYLPPIFFFDGFQDVTSRLHSWSSAFVCSPNGMRICILLAWLSLNGLLCCKRPVRQEQGLLCYLRCFREYLYATFYKTYGDIGSVGVGWHVKVVPNTFTYRPSGANDERFPHSCVLWNRLLPLRLRFTSLYTAKWVSYVSSVPPFRQTIVLSGNNNSVRLFLPEFYVAIRGEGKVFVEGMSLNKIQEYPYDADK